MSGFKLLPRLYLCAAILCLLAGCAASGGLAKRLHVTQSLAQLRDGDAMDINDQHPGEQMDITPYLSARKYTVVAFTSEYWPECQSISPRLVEWTKMLPDIAVRIVEINRPSVQGVDWHSPVAQQYKVGSLPAFRVFGPNKKPMYAGQQAVTEVRQTMHEDME